MNKTFYFIAGLPRSGSSVLSSILNQNPRFYSGPSSPVIGMMASIENYLFSEELYFAYPKPNEVRKIISSILPQYYSDRSEEVIFDKNRAWPSNIEYISGYFGIRPKIICPVRDTSEILTSFISMLRRNPMGKNGKINFIDGLLVKSNIPLTDDNRCNFIASSDGILGLSYNGIEKALLSGYDNCLHFVEYKDLVNNPRETMVKIYNFLDEEPFEHDFENLKDENKQNDEEIYGLADMHKVRKTLKITSEDPHKVLSQNILNKCKNTEFWRLIDNEDCANIGGENINTGESKITDYQTKLIG